MSHKILHITNGDSTVGIMKEANMEGDFLPWRDVLHVGPVPEGLSFEALSQVRADFIKEQGWGDAEAIQKSFDERLEIMNDLQSYDKIILWFEHDLYDQLQLIEILAYFESESIPLNNISLICTENYLGMLTAEEMKSLTKYESHITQVQLELASRAWQAFRSTTPEKWQALLHEDTTVLPFLEGAVVKMLEEYPSCTNGLSRTAQKALEIIVQGEEKRPGRIFGLYIETEERRFLGDTVFWDILSRMLTSAPPLLNINMPLLPIDPAQHLALTETGEEVLEGKKSWLEVHLLDEWIGGVHLNEKNIWCWNASTLRIEHV